METNSFCEQYGKADSLKSTEKQILWRIWKQTDSVKNMEADSLKIELLDLLGFCFIL
jgi:hypothetical protein